MLRIAAVMLALVALSGVVHAMGEGVTVFQENKKFSTDEVTVKRGQTVTFTNKDPITHNVFSRTSGMAFDLKVQKAGESSDVKFDNVGEADVLCAIHPQMKMKVKVVD